MSQTIEVKVPDIGDFKDVPVIEIFVKPGDTVKVEDPLCSLESDKATMDVPSSAAGVVKEVKIKVGDKVAEGSVVVILESAASGAAAAAPAPQAAAPAPVAAAPAAPAPVAAAPAPAASGPVEVKVPDIGDFKDVPVIEVFVKVGDTVKQEDALCSLESDKATMDVPSSAAGVVKEVRVKVGDKVSEGSVVVVLEGAAGAVAAVAAAPAAAAPAPAAPAVIPPELDGPAPTKPFTPAPAAAPYGLALGGKVHASPSVRAFARELGVDLSKVTATGPKSRIQAEDVKAYIKGVMSGQTVAPTQVGGGGITGGGSLDLLPWPKVDFAKFGPIEAKPLSRIKKISGANLARNWVMIPAVTYHEDADITDLEAFRVQLNKENEKSGQKLTMLAFIIKACVKVLQQFPELNTSLDGDNLVYKKYYHIGFAADTPNGLVVPVLKDADKKGVLEIAKETGELAKLARDGKLKPADMQGATFTISSVGGIGGTAFSPIVNAPEVAILGVSKSSMKPVWNGKEFVPRLIVPLSLSADHRVIDGALATRFNAELAKLLADFRRVML
ncbi:MULTISPECIES: dihydrolipoyllysine-residue acetyltransferase [Azospira]|uniref:Acetyltransferase component of pyruvate dehydrogenase complex n=1 Tax=Azospira oryzae (strain ATCC BAA-33 / DSM 13638 / PS) TaxID=640081 RepID=G8QPQ7_AZOOP|nr:MULTISPECIES: dihydrolipoyllysine-residue acetyltransferase [Azospira]AEV25966.1 pyruvate dehydrogenase complex dihydrolipoamide acetyltransferase, long form [Azospira oryzae PS]MDK9690614.1 dihydrolipoyllysine-residue acetyltransferase [Azospira sp.]